MRNQSANLQTHEERYNCELARTVIKEYFYSETLSPERACEDHFYWTHCSLSLSRLCGGSRGLLALPCAAVPAGAGNSQTWHAFVPNTLTHAVCTHTRPHAHTFGQTRPHTPTHTRPTHSTRPHSHAPEKYLRQHVRAFGRPHRARCTLAG